MTNEQLVTLVQAGENVADNMLQLWKQNEAFISQMAMKYRGYAEIDDLKQEGYISLCNAVDHFDLMKGVPFINYAAFWIMQGMQHYVSNCTGAIRLPKYARKEVQQYNKIVCEYWQWYGNEPTDYEMASFMGVDEEKLSKIKCNAMLSNMRSLEAPMSADNEEIALGEMLATEEDVEENVIKKIDTAALKNMLWKTVEQLPSPYLDIICLRYRDNMSLSEVSQNMGVTKSNARRVEYKALGRLRELDKNKVLHSYHEEYLTSAHVLHVGIDEFNRTWTSSVEKAVLSRLNIKS